ncbi:hypothetical protein AB0D57_22420 [Streptomyces sp. NPDC048275]|uniref:hypothetical protein n=1 Tax=Streptomyces sp. NPDC048275 TaxID=3155629 RepID=UPI003408AC7F
MRKELGESSARLLASVREAERSKDGDSRILREKVSAVVQDFTDVTRVMAGYPATDGKKIEVLDKNQEVGPAAEPDDNVDVELLLRQGKELAKSLRSKEWTDSALQEAVGVIEPVLAEEDIPRGERAVALTFEIASYAALDYADAEAVTRKAVSEATRHSSDDVKGLVKTGQYILGPSALMIVNDLTALAGDAVRNINAEALKRCVARMDGALNACPSLTPPFPDAPSAAVGPPGIPRPPSLPGARVVGTAVDDAPERPIRIEGVKGIRPPGPRRPGFGRF